MKKILLVTFTLAVGLLAAQTSYLPDNAANIKHTPSGPDNPMFKIVGQSGSIPYKGHNCDDQSGSFEEGADGKKYGDLEYATLKLHIQHYTAEGKFTFDNIMKYTPPAEELKRFEESARAENGPDYKRTVTNKELPDGRMVLVNDLYSTCVENKYKSYNYVHFSAYALIGSTLIKITGDYYSSDQAFAEKVYRDVVEKVKKKGF
jgi:hypothetical protein